MKTLLLGVPMMLLAASPARAITITIDPAAQTVPLGSSATVSLLVSDLADSAAPSLSTFDLDLTFVDAVLSFVDATFGDPVLGDQLDLRGLGTITATTPGAGVVNLFELSLDLPSDLNDLQAGAFVMARLTFAAQAPGTSALELSIVELGDATGDPLAADVAGGTITVEGAPGMVVPEPASSLLLLTGLAGVAIGRRKKKKE